MSFWIKVDVEPKIFTRIQIEGKVESWIMASTIWAITEPHIRKWTIMNHKVIQDDDVEYQKAMSEYNKVLTYLKNKKKNRARGTIDKKKELKIYLDKLQSFPLIYLTKKEVYTYALIFFYIVCRESRDVLSPTNFDKLFSFGDNTFQPKNKQKCVCGCDSEEGLFYCTTIQKMYSLFKNIPENLLYEKLNSIDKNDFFQYLIDNETEECIPKNHMVPYTSDGFYPIFRMQMFNPYL